MSILLVRVSLLSYLWNFRQIKEGIMCKKCYKRKRKVCGKRGCNDCVRTYENTMIVEDLCERCKVPNSFSLSQFCNKCWGMLVYNSPCKGCYRMNFDTHIRIVMGNCSMYSPLYSVNEVDGKYAALHPSGNSINELWNFMKIHYLLLNTLIVSDITVIIISICCTPEPVLSVKH